MYKLSVPISVSTMTKGILPLYLKQIRACQAERVFLCGIYPAGIDESMLDTDPEWFERVVRYFQENGLEVGVWVGAFGHGVILTYETDDGNKNGYTPMQGVMGETVARAYCPSDEKFAARYCADIAKVAAMHPDLIMLDDDFRLNLRSYYMGCFCEHHLKDFYRRIGEEIPREEIEQKVFTGGANKYRTAYMQMMRDTLLDFAKRLRETVDAVDPSIRLGTCTIHDNWDYAGTDSFEIARAFAGETEPFFRTIGAPYWADPLIEVIENTRLQMAWSKDSGVEVFAEGDTYPRPRYQVPSKVLEMYDLALIADQNADGILKYMFDYGLRPEYETGYIDRHVRNESLRNQIGRMFFGKKAVGVYSFNAMHKVENWVLPETVQPYVANRMINSYQSTGTRLFASNSIPVSYEPIDAPVILFGENARYADLSLLGNGALLDIPAAEILQQRGIDVGLLDAEDAVYIGERYLPENDVIRNLEQVVCKKITCREGAVVHSRYEPDATPACYTYENADGQRFAVFAWDHYLSVRNTDHDNNYYRQKQVVDAVEWVGRKKLPAVISKNPGLYLYAAADEDSLSVLLCNISQDDIFDAEIRLDGRYEQVVWVGREGRLSGDVLTLSELPAYQVMAFTVKGRIG